MPQSRRLPLAIAVAACLLCRAFGARAGEAQRAMSDHVDPAAEARMWEQVRQMPSEPAAVRATQAVNSWQLIGPLYSVKPDGGYVTGRVRDIDAIHHRVLAATGGLWRFNFGPVAMCDSVPASWFGAFATSPVDPNTILLGTGEYPGGPGSGMYRTTDGGASWVHVRATMSFTFSRIRFAPDGVTAHATGETGYYRSTDAGVTWDRTFTGSVSDLAMLNDDPNTLYLTAVGLGLFRSIDAGLHWLNISPPGASQALTKLGAVAALRPIPGFPIYLYTVFGTSVFRSIDGGTSWTTITPAYNVGDNGMGSVITICPTDPYTILYGNTSLNRSIDGGDTWTSLASTHLHADYHVFAWESGGNGVWAGHDGGWSYSSNRGLNWDSSQNVMPITQFYRIDCEKTETGTMLGGTQDNNVLVSTNEGLVWTDPALSSTEGDADGVCVDQYSPNRVFAVSGVSNGPLAYPHFRSFDFGVHWNADLAGLDPTTFQGSIRSDNAFPLRLVCSAGSFVYDSADSGATWQKSNTTAFPGPVANLTSTTRVSPSAVLYACLQSFTPGQRLFIRNNGAWSEGSSGLPSGLIYKVIPHPWAAYADIAWALVNGDAGWKIYRTDNRGGVWNDISGDLPIGIPLQDLVPDPRNPSHLYVGTFLGCYRTLDGGAHWERWNNGMPPSVKVSEMTYIDLTSTTGQFFVVAATWGRSVWKRDISGDDPVPSVACADRAIAEGDAGQTVVPLSFTLSAPYFMPVQVQYTLTDGTASTSDNDYVAASGTVTFAPGTTQQYVQVLVNGDTKAEPDETFTVTLSNPIRATLANAGTATVTILDDDTYRLMMKDVVVTDGPVRCVAPRGNTVYFGGSFTKVGRATGSAVPLDVTSGLPSWLPKVAGNVYAAVPDGSGGWYLGGQFTHVGGLPRLNLARVYGDHTVAPWNPVPNGAVMALAVNGTTVYAGGYFTTVGSLARPYLAIIGNSGSEPQSADAHSDGPVTALALDNFSLFVGGSFTLMGGQPRNNIAELSSNTLAATAWNPNADASTNALLVTPDKLYAGGNFLNIGGSARHHLAALARATGLATAWNPDVDGPITSLAWMGSTLATGGIFSNVHAQPRANLAAIDTASANPTAWSPNPDTGVNALLTAGSKLYVGGLFTTASGTPRDYLAAFDIAGGALLPWNPDPNATVYALAAQGTDVLAAGTYTSLAAQPRANLGALDANTGALLPWNPGADNLVNTLLPAAGGVYVGGTFTSTGGQPRVAIALLDSASGSARAFNANASAAANVRALLQVGTRLFAGGNFSQLGGGAHSNIAALDPTTGSAVSWNASATGQVNALASDGTLLFVGGAMSAMNTVARSGLAAVNVSNGLLSPWGFAVDRPISALLYSSNILYLGGSFNTVGTLARPRLAAVATVSTTISGWTPAPDNTVSAMVFETATTLDVGGAFTHFGGVPRNHLASGRPSSLTIPNWAPEADGTVSSLAWNGPTLWMGGDFNRVGGMPQSHIAAIVPVNTLDAPLPHASATLALTLSPNPSAGRVRLDYALPAASHVRIGIYDVLGRRIAQPTDERQGAGPHSFTWAGADTRNALAPGLYLVRLEAGEGADALRAERRVVILH
jgi:hypothetical protein